MCLAKKRSRGQVYDFFKNWLAFLARMSEDSVQELRYRGPSMESSVGTSITSSGASGEIGKHNYLIAVN